MVKIISLQISFNPNNKERRVSSVCPVPISLKPFDLPI